jgi:hypothetical protein
VPHPHTSALFADAFAQGVIRSQTDYAVYAAPRVQSYLSSHDELVSNLAHKSPGGGMRGADISYYKNRGRYHTPEDSVRGMGEDGARRALWASMEVMRGAGAALLDMPEGALEEDIIGDAEPSTYFERMSFHLL